MRFQLVPNSGLAPVPDTSTAEWELCGGQPSFDLVQPEGEIPAPGWYLLSTDIETTVRHVDGGRADAFLAIVFLPESGSIRLTQRPVPAVKNRRTRVIHVPAGTHRMVLQVSPWLDSLRGSELTLKPLASAVAATMMSADVAASSVRGAAGPRSIATKLKAAGDQNGARAIIEEIAKIYEDLQKQRSNEGIDRVAGTSEHYRSWRKLYATMNADDAKRLAAKCEQLANGGPSISVVMPVYNPDVSLLEAAIRSVTGQVYQNWQLCLVNDASTDSAIPALLDTFAAGDERIRVHHRATNGHITAATQDALELATGDFVAFMDHDDLIAPFALAAIALESENADVLYTDEDKIDADGQHYAPHFKPPWNPELLLGQNYISHLTVIRRSSIDAVGGLRSGFDGAQDHDLLLRVTSATTADRIVHIPLVAYHWRAIEGSTAHEPGAKNYTEEASVLALRDHLPSGWSVDHTDAQNAYRCVPPLSKTPLVSIVIPTRDHLDLVIQCVESLATTTYPRFEVLIVDNDSQKAETLEWFEAFDNGDDRRVIPAPGPFNYSKINNIGVAAAKGELILLLNNDTEVIEPDWLSAMVGWILQENVGAVGAKLLYPNDTIQHAGVLLGLGGLAGHGHIREPRYVPGYFNRLAITHEVGAVTAACLLTWRSTWDELGGLEEDLAVAFNDVDFCMRVRHEAKQRILWTPDATLYHHESISRGYEDDPVKVARFNEEVDYALARWADVLDDDPAYSPNLTLTETSFTIASEPRFTPPWAGEPAENTAANDQAGT